MLSLLQLLSLALTASLSSFTLAVPTEQIEAIPPKYENERPEYMCHVDIYREELFSHHKSKKPFSLSAKVYDNGNNQVAEFKLKRCDAGSKKGGQRCKFWNGLEDEMVLSPVFKKAANKEPERDYVQIDIGQHTSFATDNAPGSKGLTHHCRQSRYFRDVIRTQIWWTCNFQCCEVPDKMKANETSGWVPSHGWNEYYDSDLGLKDDDS